MPPAPVEAPNNAVIPQPSVMDQAAQTPAQRANAIRATGQQPAAEPAVLSSTHVDEAIAEGKARLAELAQKGMTVSENGATYANGTPADAPADAAYNADSGQFEYNGKSYNAKEFYGDGTDQNPGDADWQAVKNLFAPLKSSLDSNTLDQVQNIERQYDNLRSQQMQSNQTAEQSNLHALLTAGTARVAPLTASGLMLAKTSYGLSRLASLDADENDALTKARTAQESGDMQIMMDAIDKAESIRQSKADQAQKVMDSIQKANEDARTAQIQSSRDSAIAGLIAQGVTDPSQLLSMLNSDQSGKQTGDFTSDEVAKVVKNLTVDGNAANLPSDLRTFEYIKDNYGLPEEIASLPENQQYFAYLAALKKANTAPKTTNSTKGSDATTGDTVVPTWDAYKAAAIKQMGVSYLMSADEDKLREQYNADFSGYQPGDTLTPFTPTEKKKLEQSGMLGKTRKEQLDFLYGGNTNTDQTLPSFLQ